MRRELLGADDLKSVQWSTRHIASRRELLANHPDYTFHPAALVGYVRVGARRTIGDVVLTPIRDGGAPETHKA
ncbi:hypothetical protein MHEL_43840 [Mycolicibacterium helvum]|uniref:Uncharacterized protein n=1 Tax=Mycolicibacterium helvum TaxID=1534349 RepID=A0A7I7TCB7_9MYCO|nr:hypothetical protein MHEL_43840 [Mycolicibacterium helvum]